MRVKNTTEYVKKIFDVRSESELKEGLIRAQKISWKNFGRRVCFYAPSFMYYKTSYLHCSSIDFPTISVTGKGCSLNCKHCGGVVLNTMYPATTSKTLFDLCDQLKHKGASGCLISGGCLPDGSVPLARFTDAIDKIKRELGLTLFVHTGTIDLPAAKALKKAGVDAALIDVVGSDETIREIYNMNITTEHYANSMKALHDAGMAFIPHVIVGLHYGKLKGELEALRTISRTDPSALVIIALMPIHGTEMEKIEPPKPLDIAKVATAARLMFPEIPLVLGCMRPKNRSRGRTEILAIQAGVNGIAFPTEEAIRFAESKGYKAVFYSSCCAQVYSDVRLTTPEDRAF